MNELQVSLEILKLVTSGECIANLNIDKKAEIILENFKKIYKVIIEEVKQYSKENSSAEDSQKILKAYRLSSITEDLELKSESILSAFKNLEIVKSGSTLTKKQTEFNAPDKFASSAVRTADNKKTALLNSAAFILSSGNDDDKDEFVVYVFDPIGKDNLPVAIQLNVINEDELEFGIYDGGRGKNDRPPSF